MQFPFNTLMLIFTFQFLGSKKTIVLGMFHMEQSGIESDVIV